MGIEGAIIVEIEKSVVDSGDEPTALSLAEAVSRALRCDAKIQAALARVRVAEADAQQARLLPNPILNVAARFPVDGPHTVFEVGMAADLLAVLQRPGKVGVADKRLRAAAGEALATVLDVLAGVQEHYAAVQALDEELLLLEQRRQLIDKLLGLARARLAAGEGKRLDVTALESQRVQLEVELADKRLERSSERLALGRLIGRPSGGIEWQVTAWQPPAEMQAGESAWLAAALARRPEVQAKMWELAALGDEEALAKWAALQGSDVGFHAERDGTWTIGPAATVPLPLFDWGQAKVAKANAERAAAQHALTQLQREIIEEVRRAHLSYVSALGTMQKARDVLLPLEQQRYEQAQAAYRAGEADLTSLLMAEQDLNEGRQKVVELHKKATVTLVKLHRAVGGAGVAATLEGGRK